MSDLAFAEEGEKVEPPEVSEAEKEIGAEREGAAEKDKKTGNSGDQNSVESISVKGSKVQKTEAEDISKIEIPREEAELVAPNGDVAQVPKLLPGTLARPAESEVSIRGSDSRDSLYYIDDISVPTLFEPISGTAVVPNRAIESLSFYPGNFDSEWGNSTGGVIKLDTRGEDIIEPFSDVRIKLPTYISLYHEQDTSDDGSIIVSVRKSTLEPLFDLIADMILEGAVLIPSFQDAYIQHYFGGDDFSLKTRYIHSRSAVRATFPDDEAKDQSGFSAFDFDRGYDLIGTEYKSMLAGLAYEVSPYFTNNMTRFNFGDNLFDLEGNEITVPVRTQIELGDSTNLYLGSEWKYLDYFIELSLPDTIGADNAEDPTSVDNIRIATSSKIVEFASWATYEHFFGDLLISPSIRFFGNSTIGKDSYDPRLIAKYRLTDVDVLKFGVGQYSAAPSVERLADDFGNPDLPWIVSTHYSLGWDTLLKGAWTSNLQLFRKNWRDVNSRDPVRRFIADTTKTSTGLEWFLRFSDGGPTFGWLSYTFSETKFTKEGEPELPDPNDVTHILNLVANHKFSDTFQLGGRFKYQTGYPTTPVGNVIYQVATDEYYPEVDDSLTFTDRVPDTIAVTFFAQNEFEFEKWQMTLRYGVEDYQLNKSSPDVVYNYDFSRQDYATGIPAIPFIEFRGTF